MRVLSMSATVREVTLYGLAPRRCGVRCVILVQMMALMITLRAQAAWGGDQPTVNPSAARPDVLWLASPMSTSCTGPTDGSGRAWTDPAFDEAGWVSLTPPDGDFVKDRYYRGHVQVAAPAAELSLFVSTDDGCEVFVNGYSLGAFGAGCHGLGCVNRAGSCGSNRCVPPLLLDDGQLVPGANVVAVHVSNGGGGGFFNATVLHRPSGTCANCRLDAGEQCDPTVVQGACVGVLCADPGAAGACTCPTQLR